MSIPASTAPLVLLIVLSGCYGRTAVAANKSGFRAVYAFGDSILDTGNSGYMANPNYKCMTPPYGRDFPNGHIPTGRYSNGKIVTDFIASDFGINDYMTPFLDPKLTYDGHKQAVNFAFGGTGYDERTAFFSGTPSIQGELDYFKKYVEKLKTIQGEEGAQMIIKDSLVVINGGNNDMAINFYDFKTRRLQFRLGEYQDFLLKNLQKLLSGLHDQGVRKMAVSGLLPLGCLPMQMTMKLRINDKDRKCVDKENIDSEEFNNKLRNLLSNFAHQYPDTKFVYFDMYNAVKDMVDRPQNYGFVEVRKGCCGSGLNEISSSCNSATPTCPDATKFLFWDAGHPTQTGNRYLADYFHKHVLPQL